MDEYIKREYALDAVLFALAGTGLQSTAIYAIRDVPTADVVPKSEYDAVVSAVDNSTKEFLKLHDAYQNAKAEVERLEGELIVERTRRENAVNAYHDTKSEVDRWRRNLEAVLEERAETKSEVAREIFAEIERLCDAHLYWNNCSIIQRDDIAELKKKYTENENG